MRICEGCKVGGNNRTPIWIQLCVFWHNIHRRILWSRPSPSRKINDLTIHTFTAWSSHNQILSAVMSLSRVGCEVCQQADRCFLGSAAVRGWQRWAEGVSCSAGRQDRGTTQLVFGNSSLWFCCVLILFWVVFHFQSQEFNFNHSTGSRSCTISARITEICREHEMYRLPQYPDVQSMRCTVCLGLRWWDVQSARLCCITRVVCSPPLVYI